MDIQDIARNTFTISALLLTATIVLLNYSWKKLKVLMNTMPVDKRRVKFNLKSVSDNAERDKYSFISAQFLSCVFLVFALIGALAGVFIMSGVMVGDVGGPYAADNFEFAVVAMRIGVFCLFFGVVCSGFVYLEDLAALYTGKPSIATTELQKLPTRPPQDKVWSYIVAGLLDLLLIVMFLIEIFIPSNQWVKMVITSVAACVLFLVARLLYRVYVRIRSDRSTNPREMGRTVTK